MATKAQIENGKMLYQIMAGIPYQVINLDVLRDCDQEDKDLLREGAACGATACIAGWSSAHPYFKRRGFSVGRNGADDNFTSRWHGLVLGLRDIALELFGPEGRNMFEASRLSLNAGQKAEAMLRVRAYLVEVGAITRERSEQLARIEAAEYD